MVVCCGSPSKLIQTSLVMFIQKYFILFDAVVNGTDFCVLILHPATLGNLFILPLFVGILEVFYI